MKKILAISNSFGVDANRYLYGVARAGGEAVRVATLFIGGCSLYRHYKCMLSENAAYALHVNGMETGFFVSLKEALLADEWDIITFQQASPLSGSYDTYFPYLRELSAYARKYAPAAKQYIHATWGWSDPAVIESSRTSFKSSDEMFAAIDAAYKKVALDISADGYIPAGALMQKLYKTIGDKAYRDGHHASYGVGRYALALVWYMTLFGKDIDGVVYRDLDESVTDEEILAAEKCAKEAVKENSYKISR